MAGINGQLISFRNQLEEQKSWLRAYADALEKRVDELEERLEKYDTPASSPGKKTSQRRRPIPVPERPDAMEAAGDGKDPR